MRRIRIGSFVVFSAVLGGCASTPHRAHAPKPATAEGQEGAAKSFAQLMARENGPFKKHHLELFGGLATGDYESTGPAMPECTKDADEDQSCGLKLGMGDDEDGEPFDIVCFVDTTPRGPFGTVVAHRLAGMGLAEPPKVAVKKVGEGIAIEWIANTQGQNEEGGTLVGTTKVATLYSQGYSATCSDARAGGRATFRRVVGDFFASLRFAPNPRRPAHAALGYDVRRGDQSSGFRYGLVEKRGDGKPGTAEVHFAYAMESDGKTWKSVDSNLVVLRDPAGKVELYRHAASSHDGTKLAALTAKPTEDGKYRLKSERAGKSDALESTPRAPLTTELWAASELSKVAKGKAASYRYATLGFDDAGDPKFSYITLSRSAPGVLLEEEEDKKAKGDLKGSLKDELHLAPDGTVTKEVAPSFVSERVYTFGKLPGASKR
jgi:hypothetical protein